MNPKIEKLLKLPLYQRLGILGVLSLVIVGLFVWMMVLPNLDELQRLEDEQGRLELDLIQKRQIANNLPKFKAEFAKMEKQLEQALTKLPNKAEIPTLLTNLATLAKDSGLEVKSFRPMNEINKGFFAEVPSSIKLQGSYHQVAIFAQSVGELSRIVNLTDLKLTQPKILDDRASLNVDCKVTTFRFVDN